MLSRIVQIPLRYRYSAALKPQFNNVPATVKNVSKEVQELGQFKDQSVISNLGQYSINFSEEIDGKKLVLRSFPQVRSGFNVADLSTAVFSLGAAFGILSNLNYMLTLVFGLGAIATTLSSGRVNFTRGKNIITAIEIDKTQRLHITFLGNNGYDNVIVDRKDFQYNLLRPGSLGAGAIWCKINNVDFWISKRNLQVNNQQIHNLF